MPTAAERQEATRQELLELLRYFMELPEEKLLPVLPQLRRALNDMQRLGDRRHAGDKRRRRRNY